MKEKTIIFLVFLFFGQMVSAQKIDIGLFQHLDNKKVFIEASSGKYLVKSKGKRIYKLKKNRNIILNYVNGKISISNSKRDFGLHTDITIASRKYNYNKIHSKLDSRKNSELNIKLVAPKLSTRIYQGNLSAKVINRQFEIINQLSLPDYLSGVVEAESGPSQVLEYYKNQATICRTYALKNLKKHQKESFNLCDGVHCQAYKGKSSKNPIIQKAVKQTKELVIVDNSNKLISALFSANCGGQTNNSEDVWTSALPYLRSIIDTFCIDQRQAFWKKKIEFNTWKNFLKEKEIVINDTLTAQSVIFSQPKRTKYYTVNKQKIKLTSIRYGLKLRSTFFSITSDGNFLQLSGRGYGHGVGMCQEGAMNMAKKGFKFDEIIHYYYTGVKIVPLRKLTDKFLE